jgi:hypothetical protein
VEIIIMPATPPAKGKAGDKPSVSAAPGAAPTTKGAN